MAYNLSDGAKKYLQPSPTEQGGTQPPQGSYGTPGFDQVGGVPMYGGGNAQANSAAVSNAANSFVNLFTQPKYDFFGRPLEQPATQQAPVNYNPPQTSGLPYTEHNAQTNGNFPSAYQSYGSSALNYGTPTAQGAPQPPAFNPPSYQSVTDQWNTGSQYDVGGAKSKTTTTTSAPTTQNGGSGNTSTHTNNPGAEGFGIS